MSTIGNTCYKFPVRKSGKRPEFDGSVKLKRKTKQYTERVLRHWQKEAFKKLFKSRFFLVKAFCGAGKTTLSVVMALYDVIENQRKQIFIVPQEHIGDGFAVSGKFYVPTLGVVNLSSAQNFCEDSERKIDMLVNFLKRKFSRKDFSYGDEYAVDGSEMIAVCTHFAFNMAMRKIIDSGELDQVVNTSFYVDEAHHIKGGESEIENELEKDYNQLGQVLYRIIKKADSNNFRLGLTTATYLRGDLGIIIKKDYLKNFNRYELDFLDHFKTLGIDSVYVNFEEYKVDPTIQIVENIRKELKTEKHLIIAPARGSKWRKHDPDLNKFVGALRQMIIEEGLNPDEIFLNLVPVNTQKKNKAVLLKEPKDQYDKNNSSKIKIIMTCRLGREGTDWCPCSRLHNASIEETPTLAIQTFGRLFRKFDKKNTVGITYYIKQFKDLKDSENKKEFLSDRLNSMLCLMIIDDLLNPIVLPELPLTKHPATARNSSKQNTKNKGVALSDIFGNDEFLIVKQKILESISVNDNFDEDFVESVIEKVISPYNFSEVIKIRTKKGLLKAVTKESVIAGLKAFLLRARSEALRTKGVDVSLIRNAGFDVLVEKNKLTGNFWCGNLDGEKFAQFKNIVKEMSWSQEQKTEIANKLKNVLEKKYKIQIVDCVEHYNLVKKYQDNFTKTHNAYSKVAAIKKVSEPNPKDVAKELKISLATLMVEIEFYNQILPKGYLFFAKKSKLFKKFAGDALVA